jgi:hypothetical protein
MVVVVVVAAAAAAAMLFIAALRPLFLILCRDFHYLEQSHLGFPECSLCHARSAYRELQTAVCT